MFRFIEANTAAFPVAVMCRVLEVSRSGYYAWRQRQPSPRQRDDQRLVELIRTVHNQNRKVYGSPRIHAELIDDYDEQVGVNRIARLMARAGIEGVSGRSRRPRTTTPPADRRAKPPDRVQRDFTASAPDRLWLGDITYLETAQGWRYLAVLLDVFSRMIVGWATAAHLGTSLPLAALRMALSERHPRPGMLIHHTDSGSQYLSAEYTRWLTDSQLLPSAAGSAYDNAMVESFFGSLENELVRRETWTTHDAADLAVFSYIGWYNNRRRHTSLDMRSPVRYEREEVNAEPTLALFTQP